MTIRPTQTWRADPALSAQRSEAQLDRIDDALRTFETELTTLDHPSDDQVFEVIKHVVLSLNALNGHDGAAAFDTIDREELCDYIDESLTEAGIDVEALAQRRGINPSAITNAWRDW